MSELIERIAAIRATWQEPSYTDPWNVLTEMRDRINALPTIALPCWHKAEDDRPKHAGRYLVWCGVNWHGEGMHGDMMIARYDRNLQRWYVEADESLNGPICGHIRYWMPIEPPKEDGERREG